MMETYLNGAITDIQSRRLMMIRSWMPGRRILIGTVVLVLAVGFAAYYFLHGSASGTQYVTTAASEGEVVQAVTATGTVNPVVTVQVGSYVSGPIVQMLCDFNTEVKKGQLCAKIDPRTYQNTLDQAQANLANASAQRRKDAATLEYAKVTYGRDVKLINEHVISNDALDSAKSTYGAAAAQIGVDKAVIMQQQAAVSAAKVNLGYTNIISPVDGTVVLRTLISARRLPRAFRPRRCF